MKKKYIGILAMTVLFALSGCGTKQVSYEVEKTSSGKDSKISQEESAGTTLMETLGVEEEWTEKVSLDGGDSFHIAAEVSVPDVPKMSLMEVSEYYYTSEDKKRVAEHFFDEGSIQVNLEAVPTKDNIARTVQEWEKALERFEEEGIEEKIAIAKSEKKKQESLLNEAPKADEISLSPDDYLQDSFKGLIDGKEFELDFDINEEEHISQWTLCASLETYKEFNETGAEFWSPGIAFDNKCALSKEEAEKKAVQICEELGITSMAPVRVKAVQWGDQKENNGYYVVLGRENAGVVMEPVTYFTGNEQFYRDTEYGGKTPYEQEIIDIGINDNGVFWMRYSGSLSVDKEGTEVKLLSFDQIKEAFRKEIISNDIIWSGMDAHNLDLIYFRFMNEKQSGKYTYVPVWRLTPYEVESGMGSNVAEWNCIFINGIDGSPVDIDEAGGNYYVAPESLLYNYE